MSEERAPRCRLCGGEVVVTRESYEAQEGMHWLCFHIMFEHWGDPDEPCRDPSCPRWHLEVYRQKLADLGCDPDEVLGKAIDESFGL